MMNMDKISPKFQAIFVTGSQKVVGYEVFPYYRDEGQEYELTSFLNNRTIPEEYRLEVDQHVRRIAFKELSALAPGKAIYVTIRPELYTGTIGDSLVEELETVKDQVVLGILLTDEFTSWADHKHFTYYLQMSGLRVSMKHTSIKEIAMSDIVHVKPDIIEIDMNDIEDDVANVHRELLHVYSIAASKIGASLLFQGVESFQQLTDAWKHGARFVQGNFLAMKKESTAHNQSYQADLVKHFRSFVSFEQNRIQRLLDFTVYLDRRVSSVLEEEKTRSYDDLALTIGKRLEDVCFRVYIVNNDGEQQSANAVQSDGVWKLDEANRWQNWSWRPYFLENIIRMNVDGKGVLSVLYKDLTSNEHIRTFSYPITTSEYVFIDIAYHYLFDHDYVH
ncbi:EAL domain protein [Geomicrobium sp. JCM 19055]|nr:EAL domain protein [Geomicrobium sp. JCM 19055]